MNEPENEKDELLKQETALKQAKQIINEQADEIERLQAKLRQAEDTNNILRVQNEILIKVQTRKEKRENNLNQEQQALNQNNQKTIDNIQAEKSELKNQITSLNQENLNQSQSVFEIQPKLKELLKMIKERYYGAYSIYASTALNLSEKRNRSNFMNNQIVENLKYLEEAELVYLSSDEQQQFKDQVDMFKKDLRVQIFSVSQKFQKQIEIFKEDLRTQMTNISQELNRKQALSQNKQED